MYTPRGRGDQISYTFLLRITCKKKRGDGVQKACKIAYVLNGRPQTYMVKSVEMMPRDIESYRKQSHEAVGIYPPRSSH